MKKLLTLLFAGMAFYGCQKDFTEEPQENIPATRATVDGAGDYYWLGDEKIPLQKMDNKFYVMYDAANEERLTAELKNTRTVLAEAKEEFNETQFADIKGFDSGKYTNLKAMTVEGDYEKIAPVLSHAFYAAPYYKTDIGEGRLTNRFSIALKNESDVKLLAKLAEENSVEMLGVSELDGWYELACTRLSAGNALEMANLFYETGLFASVGYDLGARGRIANINEPLYTNGTLWHLGNNTTNSSVHINYIAARAIVPQASSSVKIAVIDSGVQYGHSDLYNVQPGWNAETQSSPNVVSNPHGTNVTGSIAAIPNNSQAVAGVAYGATIYPISFTVASSGNAILSSAEVMVRAINRAVSEGAKVINCSWQFSDNRIVNAVKSALDSGRIVVFASGNGYGAVSSPANSDPRIIVVGAIGKNGSRAPFSNYGSQLDVVAPGENVTSTTTGNGYAYTILPISGTSFAAPQVSAIAALILSQNPSLTQNQVADIIESTAQKVGGYSYA
ncbi:MAG: S8 family serine peptidase, partial [Rikenellaceae bacterium]|nr:S8 family serine peptidase [Rikenellaceae bacterium]